METVQLGSRRFVPPSPELLDPWGDAIFNQAQPMISRLFQALLPTWLFLSVANKQPVPE